ncbi:uncharacterized protein LOC141685930 [Apium graveolens]|uniref:uncharacterized protein LOC141685930 n=1 Tax=Apium graveolens TaxID=4045 RepID=UPI003D7B0C31
MVYDWMLGGRALGRPLLLAPNDKPLDLRGLSSLLGCAGFECDAQPTNATFPILQAEIPTTPVLEINSDDQNLYEVTAESPSITHTLVLLEDDGFSASFGESAPVNTQAPILRKDALIEKFVEQDKSKTFYYAFDVDSDGRLTKLFWDDSIGLWNFELYGDAISFDAIFDTNSWVFGYLVKAMGRNPILFITDQCPAMKVSVCDVFSDVNGLVRSKHRLRMWHIMEKFPVKEEILASCLEMQIKRMSEEVDGVTHFEIKDVRVKDKLFKVSVSMHHVVCSCKKFVMCGIVCRHAFCGLKQIGVTKFPRSLVLNHLMQTVDSGTSLNLYVVTSDYFKMEQVSLKLTTIWFDFRQVVDKAGVEMDRLEHVHNTIKKLNTELDAYDGSIVSFMKKDHIAAMVGQQPEREVNILPPNICKNKGNYFKRLMSDRKK